MKLHKIPKFVLRMSARGLWEIALLYVEILIRTQYYSILMIIPKKSKARPTSYVGKLRYALDEIKRVRDLNS